ncbi:hypothetical protein BJ138DRAFT_1128416 [Hygrophoropsis aurantiaca]|uniref:Uncharacterized protein n=1 Tax=Hygrophoropsis aurantiaca TaxID=72124 RepID=A0ACB8A602_9AGAM|nr:hypothetical protein BJ138DRAFT_1128416 [Hygrophoropsis aurantiaca]
MANSSIIAHLQIVKYVKVAGVAILSFNYTLTLEREVNLVWPGRWGIAQALFAVARYLPFASVAVDLIYSLSPQMSIHQCLYVYEAASWLNIFGVLAAEGQANRSNKFFMLTLKCIGLLVLRTQALWNENKRILIVLMITYAILCIASFVAIITGPLSYNFQPPPPQSMITCYQTSTNHVESTGYAALTLFEFVILACTVLHKFRHGTRANPGPLLTSLYRGNLIYVSCLFLTSIGNIIIFALPSEWNQLLDTFQGVLHSVLSCRLLFDLRESDKVAFTDTFISGPSRTYQENNDESLAFASIAMTTVQENFAEP